MEITTAAIVLSSLKYGDTSLIVKCFTETSGIKSYMLKGVLASKRGKLKTAYFQPLMQLELTASHKNKGGLERIKEAKVSYPYRSLYTNFSKSTVAMFLAEVLSKSIHEEEQNQKLFRYLEAALQWLDTHDEVANFHIFFMLHLSKYLGFFPDDSNEDFIYFDLQEGAFVDSLGINPVVKGEELFYFKSFLGIKFDAIHLIKMTKTMRTSLLNTLILYFELHLHGFRKPKAISVLNDVFR